jgi:hypothetical protein
MISPATMILKPAVIELDVGPVSKSAMGQKQTFRSAIGMSASPLKPDMCGAAAHVCFGPKADSCSAAKGRLFDHLIGATLNRLRRGNAERLGGLEVDDHSNFVGSVTGNSPGLAPLRIRAIACRPPMRLGLNRNKQ